MAIDHDVRAPGLGFCPGRFGDDNGMALGLAQGGVEANFFAMGDEPSGAGEHVGIVFGLGGDTGEAEIFAEFREKTLPVLFQVSEYALHENRLDVLVRMHNRIDNTGGKWACKKTGIS